MSEWRQITPEEYILLGDAGSFVCSLDGHPSEWRLIPLVSDASVHSWHEYKHHWANDESYFLYTKVEE